MRFFPSAPQYCRFRDRLPAWAHPQWLVTAVAVVVAIAGLAVPLAHADDRDDLKDKQKQVQGQISSVKGDIHEASAKVAKIARKLTQARKDLSAARTKLRNVRGDLKEARVTAKKLERKLERAQKKLKVARAELKKAQQEVADQKTASRDAVIMMSNGESGQVGLLNTYLSSSSLEEVLVGETTYGVVTYRQREALNDFVDAEERMEEREADVEDLRDEVAGAKKDADANVKTIARLVDKAEAAESSVAGLVSTTDKTRRAVVRARAADRAALRRLEKREASIKARILALSRKQKGSYNGDTGGLLAKPGPGPVTSPYGYRRHPIYGYWGLHNGTDFGTGCGAPLVAGESGTVIDTHYDEIYGNRLYLAIGKVNGASVTLVYNHLSNYAVGQGAHVKRGQVVGYSGTTGWSTGCHLHFIVMRNGTTVDPMGYL